MILLSRPKNITLFLMGCFACVTLSLTPQKNVSTHTITVVISNFRNTTGRIQLDLYRGQEGYAARKGWKTALLSKKNSVNGKILHQFKNIPTGTYGLALLDDENCNTKMDFGWIMPKEGYGFGDYYHTGWSQPHFNDFKFYLGSDKRVSMKIRYL